MIFGVATSPQTFGLAILTEQLKATRMLCKLDAKKDHKSTHVLQEACNITD